MTLSAKGDQIVYRSSFDGAEYRVTAVSWHPQKAQVAVAFDSGDLHIVKRQQNGTWYSQKINMPGRKYNMIFSPDEDVLAAFTRYDIYLYDLESQEYVPMYVGYNKASGANFCKEWEYSGFFVRGGRVLVFDMKKLQYRNFPEYFEDNNNGVGDDRFWPLRVRKKFIEYTNRK